MALLDVQELRTEFPSPDGVVRAVDGVDLSVERGETVGVVGESGCGKTMLALSILRMVPRPGRIVGGRVLFEGRDLLQLSEEAITGIRGLDVALTFQDSLTGLNPITRVGGQVREAMAAHHRFRNEAGQRVVPLLRQVRLPDAERRVDRYPHQLSGGMRQRAMVAIGISNQPAVLIADEPTTALDVTTQAQVAGLLERLNRELGTAMVLITHNFALLAGLCQRVVVMYAGRIVEDGPVDRIFQRPEHPYTWSLLRSVPRVDQATPRRLVTIPGRPPQLDDLPHGCTFHPRCAFREEKCAREEPPLSRVQGESVRTRCWVLMHRVSEAQRLKAETAEVPVVLARRLRGEERARDEAATAPQEILRVNNLAKHYPTGRGRPPVRALDGLSFTLGRSETFAVIGESGCGKSTLVRVIARLLEPTSGRVLFEGRDLTALKGEELRQIRRRMQVVFQDPYASLDPRMVAGDIVAEPMDNFGVKTPTERRERAVELLELVGLGGVASGRYPHELSGGQRQRVGIARALALNPRLIICDEPVSALDVSIQAQVMNLLKDLQRELRLTCLLVAHDLGLVRHVADRVAVMYSGRIVEVAPVADLYDRPQHPYTRLLLDSLPVPDPDVARRRIRALESAPTATAHSPTGCAFRPRCPSASGHGICEAEEPVLREVGHSDHLVACHLVDGGPESASSP